VPRPETFPHPPKANDFNEHNSESSLCASPGTGRPLAAISVGCASAYRGRLKRIEALGERIAGHFRFMCQVGSLSGTSAEMKAHAIAAFYEQAVLMETQLGRIQEELRLG
jgi:hypothetical protein